MYYFNRGANKLLENNVNDSVIVDRHKQLSQVQRKQQQQQQHLKQSHKSFQYEDSVKMQNINEITYEDDEDDVNQEDDNEYDHEEEDGVAGDDGDNVVFNDSEGIGYIETDEKIPSSIAEIKFKQDELMRRRKEFEYTQQQQRYKLERLVQSNPLTQQATNIPKNNKSETTLVQSLSKQQQSQIHHHHQQQKQVNSRHSSKVSELSSLVSRHIKQQPLQHRSHNGSSSLVSLSTKSKKNNESLPLKQPQPLQQKPQPSLEKQKMKQTPPHVQSLLPPQQQQQLEGEQEEEEFKIPHNITSKVKPSIHASTSQQSLPHFDNNVQFRNKQHLQNIYTRLCLLSICKKSKILQSFDLKNAKTEELRILININNTMQMNCLPILLFKSFVKIALGFAAKKYKVLARIICPNAINVAVEDDEMVLMQSYSPVSMNIYLTVLKNTCLGALNISLDNFEEFLKNVNIDNMKDFSNENDEVSGISGLAKAAVFASAKIPEQNNLQTLSQSQQNDNQNDDDNENDSVVGGDVVTDDDNNDDDGAITANNDITSVVSSIAISDELGDNEVASNDNPLNTTAVTESSQLVRKSQSPVGSAELRKNKRKREERDHLSPTGYAASNRTAVTSTTTTTTESYSNVFDDESIVQVKKSKYTNASNDRQIKANGIKDNNKRQSSTCGSSRVASKSSLLNKNSISNNNNSSNNKNRKRSHSKDLIINKDPTDESGSARKRVKTTVIAPTISKTLALSSSSSAAPTPVLLSPLDLPKETMNSEEKVKSYVSKLENVTDGVNNDTGHSVVENYILNTEVENDDNNSITPSHSASQVILDDDQDGVDSDADDDIIIKDQVNVGDRGKKEEIKNNFNNDSGNYDFIDEDEDGDNDNDDADDDDGDDGISTSFLKSTTKQSDSMQQKTQVPIVKLNNVTLKRNGFNQMGNFIDMITKNSIKLSSKSSISSLNDDSGSEDDDEQEEEDEGDDDDHVYEKELMNKHKKDVDVNSRVVDNSVNLVSSIEKKQKNQSYIQQQQKQNDNLSKTDNKHTKANNIVNFYIGDNSEEDDDDDDDDDDDYDCKEVGNINNAAYNEYNY